MKKKYLALFIPNLWLLNQIISANKYPLTKELPKNKLF